MESLFEFAKDNLLPHWPFFSWILIAMMIGQVTKNALWTKQRAHARFVDQLPGNSLAKGEARKPVKIQWLWWWGRKTLVLHPVAAGVVIGLIWQNPETADPAWPLAASIGYFAMSGALSTWAYEFLKSMAKKRAGIDLKLPGLDSKPPKPPEG